MLRLIFKLILIKNTKILVLCLFPKFWACLLPLPHPGSICVWEWSLLSGPLCFQCQSFFLYWELSPLPPSVTCLHVSLILACPQQLPSLLINPPPPSWPVYQVPAWGRGGNARLPHWLVGNFWAAKVGLGLPHRQCNFWSILEVISLYHQWCRDTDVWVKLYGKYDFYQRFSEQILDCPLVLSLSNITALLGLLA